MTRRSGPARRYRRRGVVLFLVWGIAVPAMLAAQSDDAETDGRAEDGDATTANATTADATTANATTANATTAGTVDRIRAALELAPAGEDGPDSSIVWYRSNRDMIPIDPVDDGPGDTGWTLAVHAPTATPDRRRELRVLYRDGTPSGGEIVDLDGEGRPLRRVRADADGTITLRESLVYRGDGTVRSVEHCTPEECVTTRFAPVGTGADESIVGPGREMHVRFAVDGRPSYIRTDRDGTVEEQFYIYADGALRERRTVGANREIRETYQDGRVVRREEWERGRRTLVVERRWDDADRIVAEIRTYRTRTVRHEWRYPQEGSITVHRRFENDRLVLDERIEGERSVRVHYRDGTAIYREVLDGEVVTDRTIYGDGGPDVPPEDLSEDIP